AGEREPLIIIVRSTDGIACTLQDVTHTIPQAHIPIEQQYPRHGCLLATWTRHPGSSIHDVSLVSTIIFSNKGGTKSYRLWRDAQVARPFCRHETSCYFFSRGRGMPRGRTTALTIQLTPAERQTLLAWQRSPSIPAGLARRGRMILLLADG